MQASLRSSRSRVEVPHTARLPVGVGTASALSRRQIWRMVVPAARSAKIRRTTAASGSKISRCEGPSVPRGTRRYP